MIDFNCTACAGQSKQVHVQQAQDVPSLVNKNNNHHHHQTTKPPKQRKQQVSGSFYPSLPRPPALNYFSHQNLVHLPITATSPIHLLSGSAPAASGVAAATVGTNGGAQHHHHHHHSNQFGLTPDARACVTATYLCVLIVNNTWLDCNLLEMICNGTSYGSGRQHWASSRSGEDLGEASSQSPEEGDPGEKDNLGGQQQQLELAALEATLDELIAYASGGDALINDRQPYLSSAGNQYQRLTPAGATTSGAATNLLVHPPAQFYQAIHGQLLKQLLFYGQTLDKEELMRLKVAADGRLGRGETKSGRLLMSSNTSLPEPPPQPPPPPPSPPQHPTSILSWSSSISRPFRGWSSYSFWPALGAASVESPRESSSVMQEASGKQVQLLRPVDRMEQYNDIATNQSLIKQQHHFLLNRHQRPYHLMSTQEQDNSGSTATTTVESLAIVSSPPQQQTITNGNGNMFVQDEIATNAKGSVESEAQAPASQQFVIHRRQPQLVQQPSNLFGVYELFQRQQQQPDLQHQHHLLHHQQQCKCTETEEQDYQQQQQCRSRCSPSARDEGRDDEVISDAGKTAPAVDVSFLLYTRQQRAAAASLAAAAAAAAANDDPDMAAAALMVSTMMAGNDTIGHHQYGPIPSRGVGALGERLNGSLPIKIIIHGFGSGGRRPWVRDMVDKLLDYEDANVIVVDWEKGAALPNYVQAAGNTRLVGHRIAQLIKAINLKHGLTGNSYHLIGFSLGAHVAGFAGMEIRLNSTGHHQHLLINRITGLDPASPLFEGYEANDRLDPSDAQFVDVIHSNGDGVLRGGFGSLQPMGHVDFYPNGGRVQVGCNSVLLSALSDIIYGKWQSLCNHRRALNFFMDSFEFNKCRFRSFTCDSYESYLRGDCFDCGPNHDKCSYMGYLANYSKGRGKMYLTTHEEAPFCANQFTIKVLGSRGHRSHWGKVEVTLVSADGRNESFWLASSTTSSSSPSPTPASSQALSSSSSVSTLVTGSSLSQQSTNDGTAIINAKDHSHQHSMQSLIVAHLDSLANLSQVQLRYTKYKGWIYSGDESWPIDKVLISDSEGQVKSYCGFNTILESHITTRLTLEPGNCTVVEPPTVATSSSSSSSSPGSSPSLPSSSSPNSSSSPSSSSSSLAIGPSSAPSSQQVAAGGRNTASSSTPASGGQQQQQATRAPRLFHGSTMHDAIGTPPLHPSHAFRSPPPTGYSPSPFSVAF